MVIPIVSDPTHLHVFNAANVIVDEHGNETLVLSHTEAEKLVPEATSEPFFCKDNINIFDDDLPKDLCREMIKRFDSDPDLYDGEVLASNGVSGVNRRHKSCREAMISGSPYWKDIDEAMSQAVLSALGNMRHYYPALRLMNNCSDDGYRIKRYENDGVDHFGWHIDAQGPGGMHRYLVLQWYLNTVAEGGLTEFKMYNIGVEAVEGRLLAFPPFWTHEHRGTKPVSGPKYIISSWVTV